MDAHTDPSLTPEQRAVLFDKATEPPFSGSLLHNHADGTYHCANCGAELFNARAKFDSGSGWPSFDSARNGAIFEKIDSSHGMQRTEVVCAKCGGHLGHLFDDGPADTTGLRYCINSLALSFTDTQS